MKVLMINKFLYKVGGCENVMFGTADVLKNHGHEVQFFGLKNDKNVVGNDLGVYVDSYDDKKIFNPFSIVYNKKAKRLLLKLLDSYKPDVVHMHNIYYHLTSSIIDACKARNIPVVITIHDYQLVCPNHMLYRFDIDSVCEECIKNKNAKSCSKYKCIKNSRLKSILGTLESNRIHKKRPYDYVSKFICPSEFILNKLVDGGYKRESMALVRNFISPINTNQIPDKENYGLFFGRLSKEKGIELLINAWPDEKELVVAGVGPLEDYVKNLNKPNIKYLGFQAGGSLKRLIQKAKFSIYPSKWYENCPLSIIESISLCTPVIAAKAGGNIELIDDGINGLFYENNNPSDLREKILSLYSNEKLVNEMYKNCLKYKKAPNIENYYEEILKIYQSVIQNNN